MAPLCVECHRSSKCLVQQRLVSAAADSSLLEVFRQHVQPRLEESVDGDVTAFASQSGKVGTWKEVDVDEKVQLVAEFGCRFIKFDLPKEDIGEPAAKRRPTSAFDIMLAAASERNSLPDRREPVTRKDDLFNDVVNYLKVSLIESFRIVRRFTSMFGVHVPRVVVAV
eukprot:scpid20458/ scgid28125/ 